jgi:mannose-6-phosphate isomerase
MALLPMVNPVKNYDWGSETEIPRLLGTESRQGTPVAELWMGAHPGAPSEVRLEDRTVSLDRLIAEATERVLGRTVADRFAGRLPFLFKVLSADRALSIQAHPSLEQAREGCAREDAAGIPRDAFERSYRDDNHKPELIRALSEFWALRGFRRHEDIVSELSAPEFGFLSDAVRSLERGGGPNELEALFGALMRAEDSVVSAAARSYAGRRVAEVAEPERARYEWVLTLSEQFGADRGIAAPLYLNCIRLAPGSAMFLPAGTLHAYLHGTGIEIMANSDNVLRGGLTSKHVDVAELTRTLVFEPDEPLVQQAPQGAPGRWHRHEAPVGEFELWELALDGTAAREREPGSPEIILVLGGEVRVTVDSEGSGDGSDSGGGARMQTLSRGGSAFVTADTGSYRLAGSGQVFVATVPLGGAR